MSRLTIVMYHYVRDLKGSRYPELKGLDVHDFREQIAYLKKHYTPISAYDLMDAIERNAELPRNSVLLTFDDGYIDHFNHVFPLLDKEKMSGCFFPPAKCILENQILDVNKIHFILASVADKRVLVDYILRALDANRTEYSLESNDYFLRECAIPSRHDTGEVMFVKNSLQRDLPEELRKTLTNDLFGEFVSIDEKAFSRELYMDIEQVSCLQGNGMYVGSHGYDHYWLNTISESDQRKEISLSLEFLKRVGSSVDRWIMCYPYGAYNDTLVQILREYHCSVGLTAEVRIADTKQDNLLALPRLDTNDLPKNSLAQPNSWTAQVALR